MIKINEVVESMYKDFNLDSQDELAQRDSFTRIGLIVGSFGSSFKCIMDSFYTGNYNPEELYVAPIMVSGLFNLMHRGYSSVKPIYNKLKGDKNGKKGNKCKKFV